MDIASRRKTSVQVNVVDVQVVKSHNSLGYGQMHLQHVPKVRHAVSHLAQLLGSELVVLRVDVLVEEGNERERDESNADQHELECVWGLVGRLASEDVAWSILLAVDIQCSC